MKKTNRITAFILMVVILFALFPSAIFTATMANDSGGISKTAFVSGVEYTIYNSVDVIKGDSVKFTITVSLPYIQNAPDEILCKIRFYHSVVFTIFIPKETDTTFDFVLDTNQINLDIGKHEMCLDLSADPRSTDSGGGFYSSWLTNVNVMESSPIIPVTNITDVPTTLATGTWFPLMGTVNPSNATNKMIVWSIVNAGTTGAIITTFDSPSALGSVYGIFAATEGIVTVRATVTNGIAVGSNYTQDFTIMVSESFVPATSITELPTTAVAGKPLTLTGKVNPSNATNKTIKWSIVNAGTTGATINGNVLNTTAAGTVTVRATVTSGIGVSTDYNQNFNIIVEPPTTYTVTVSSIGTGATGGGTYEQGATVNINAGTPTKDQQFKNWTTTSAGVTFANANNAVTSFVMPANDVTVTAVFATTEKVATPAINQADIAGGKRITITSATSGATIYYTTNGSTPTASSTLYSGAFDLMITTKTTIKAIAVKSGMTNSDIASIDVVPTTYKVTVSSVGTGATGGGDYGQGVTVNINAGTPPKDQQFKNWTTTSAGVTFANAKNAITSFVMPAGNVTVTAVFEPIQPNQEPTPEAAIDYINERLTNLVSGGTYSFNGGAGETLSGTFRVIDEKWFGTTVSIVKKGNGSTTKDSVAQSLNIIKRPAAPAVGKTDCTTSQNNNGTITGVTSAMEYQKSGDTSWKSISGTTVTGLTNGTYYVRIKAVAGSSFKSESTTVTINPYTPVPTFTQNDRYSFSNSRSNFGSSYNISDSDFQKLSDYVKKEYSASYANSVINSLQQMRNSTWGGSCYGMAATAILDKNNKINMKNMVSPPVATLWQLPRPITNPRIESAINYYAISQKIPFLRPYAYAKGNSDWSVGLQRLVQDAKDGKLVFFCYFFSGGGHAIVIYGYEAGTNGSHNLIAYDNRYPNRDVIVNVSGNYQTCVVDGSENATSVEYMNDMSVFDKIKIDGNINSPGGNANLNQTDISILATQSVTVKNEAGQTLVYNASTGEVSGTMSVISRHMVVNSTFDGSPAPATLVFTVPNSDQFTFETYSKGLDVSVMNNFMYSAAESRAADTVIVAKNEGVTVLGSGTIDFSVSLGLNNNVCDMVSLEGKANQGASLKYDAAGAVAQGNFNEDTKLTVFSNTSDIDEINFSSEYSEILITKQSGEIDLMVSSKGNGVFDASVLDGTAPPKPEFDSGSMSNFGKTGAYKNGQFTDVDENQWYGFNQSKVIATAYEYGLMKGNSANTFNPTGNITIAEAVTVASRVHSIYMTGKDNFTAGNPWYQPYVDYAVANGIIAADDFTDNYTRAATRAEMAYIFSHSLPAAEFPAQNTVNSLPDVNPGTKYYDAILTLYKAGIVTGSDKAGTFKPTANITRAEAAAIISRVILPSTRVSGKTY